MKAATGLIRSFINIPAAGFSITGGMPLVHHVHGRPLASREEGEQLVGVFEGVAVLGLDALGSAAYGPEAALTVLLPIGLLGLHYMLPLSLVIACLLAVVYISLRRLTEGLPWKWQMWSPHTGTSNSCTITERCCLD